MALSTTYSISHRHSHCHRRTLALPPLVLLLHRLVIDLLLQPPPPSQPPPPTSSGHGTLWRRRAVRLLLPILNGRRAQWSQLGVSVNFF